MNWRWFFMVATGGLLGCACRVGVEWFVQSVRVGGNFGFSPQVLEALALGLTFAALCGALGCVVRGALGVAFERKFPGFPWATLFVNAVGSFLFGLCLTHLHKGSNAYMADPTLAAACFALLVGGGTCFCGGFTTFSAFAVQTLELWRRGRTTASVVNVVANVVLGCALFSLATFLATPAASGLEGHAHRAAYPWATLCVNLAGAFLVGCLAGYVSRPSARAARCCSTLGITGFCGGLTTFSGFAAGAHTLLVNGHTIAALHNLVANLAGCLLLAFLGHHLFKKATPT